MTVDWEERLADYPSRCPCGAKLSGEARKIAWRHKVARPTCGRSCADRFRSQSERQRKTLERLAAANVPTVCTWCEKTPLTLKQRKRAMWLRNPNPHCSKKCSVEEQHSKRPDMANYLNRAKRKTYLDQVDRLEKRLASLTKVQCYALGVRNGKVLARMKMRGEQLDPKDYWKGLRKVPA